MSRVTYNRRTQTWKCQSGHSGRFLVPMGAAGYLQAGAMGPILVAHANTGECEECRYEQRDMT